jgi:hypothetical protein
VTTAPAKLSPSITTASASSVLATYQIVNNTANSRRDGRLEASVETAPQVTIDRTTYDIQRLIKQSYPPFSYRNPVFYIPALTEKTRKWFAVDATTGSSGKTQHQLLLFVQPAPGGAWKLAAAPASAAGAPLPVALSQAGTATTEAPDRAGLAVPPSRLPVLHAGLLDGRRAGPGFARGRWTSALVRGIASFRSTYGRFGWNYHDAWAPARYPTYALRTTGGGAVVWYFLEDRQTAVRTGSGQPLQPGSVVQALTGKAQVTRRFTIDSVSEFVAIIPPAGRGKITIEAGLTGNVAATAA